MPTSFHLLFVDDNDDEAFVVERTIRRLSRPVSMFRCKNITEARSYIELERKLQSLRQRTLIATRQGDFHTVARLTNEVNRLTEQIASRHHVGGMHVSGR